MLYAGIELTGLLGDVVFVAIVVAFFGLCMLFVRACAAIAGPEPAGLTDGDTTDREAPVSTAPAEVTA